MTITTSPTVRIVLQSINAALLADIKERIRFYFDGLAGHWPVLLETATIVRQPASAEEHTSLRLTICQYNDWMCQSWPNEQEDENHLANTVYLSDLYDND
ncbi:hypothetical protein GGF31_008477 [Allomyces arbusculus]|nr:hypothetical protein GGF31_008477 [Allomyces arbusculus]